MAGVIICEKYQLWDSQACWKLWCPPLTLDVRIDCKPLLSADDDTRLFANTFNMPHDLDINEEKERGF